MRRQQYKAGETVGAGFVVTDPERRVVSTNTYGQGVWGIEIRCPHCSRDFVTPIHRIRTRVACSQTCAAAAGLMGHQKGRQAALRLEAERDAERRLAPARKTMRRKDLALIQEALEAFGSDYRYAEEMARVATALAAGVPGPLASPFGR